MNDYFKQCINEMFNGNQAEAARILGVSRSSISHLIYGNRKISAKLAAKLEQLSGGKYKKEAFIWPEEISTEKNSENDENQPNLSYFSLKNKKLE